MSDARHLNADLPEIIMTGFSVESSAGKAGILNLIGHLTIPFKDPKVLAVAVKILGE